ncbi:hypothetical protein A3G55_02035 [Candidatus Giovannonibacteria bacterium RIFCSPLOWO2_12_FULL_44_25]|uniref:Uncharacterized protein n=3 Tax=Parcubacteria group TaxID=1794811 RepID=A0A837IGZ4_9BACT|nr:MAG: hypothetical protein UW15_C0024G0038 [Parcubacteria group bacterium GW2011_GWC1_44_10]KKT60221.1 MAG: hypothetical protein UW53_C0003G0132 [Candidatus Giovannonibacteria bacterium GW2011_GWA1_44_25]KKU12580.1 MAG: hypothetical protein UX18_C0018G0006 [Candidatus Azambacteria bacterium GW2011_GWC2_45_7b]KKU30068.1 MAG: hypothetical protein UX43_C0003G0161 [Candidatus Giovannonibacteria bacterium GW2011_GWB1_46_20]OGF49428.1 MAG: hypothetical protein A2120_03870 [Candidatus Giovannonibact
MAWWEETTNYIYESGLEDKRNNAPKTFWQRLNDIFFQEAVDALYLFLGIFTYVYLFAIAFLYLSGVSSFDTVATKLIRALAEPYLGAVGIYTILKESRKRRYALYSRHWGEFFVIGWLGLLTISSGLALISGFYTFTKTLELIIMLSLSIGIIYVGGAVHRP